MRVFILKVLSDKFGIKTEMPRIIYGGSINDKNAQDFLKHKEVGGVLVGNASLNLKKLKVIINVTESVF